MPEKKNPQVRESKKQRNSLANMSLLVKEMSLNSILKKKQ
jgi:hypothetical protein